jgi:adenylylsulfate kinase
VYEAPETPEIDLPAGDKTLDELVEQCIEALEARKIIAN